MFLVATVATPSFSQQLLKGIVVENDSNSVMPFVYVINNTSGNGSMSDNSGKFYLSVNENDSIICSFVGFVRLKIPVSKLRATANAEGDVKIVMHRIAYNLGPVTVSTFKIKPYEKQHMEKVIRDSKIRPISAIESPITALYMQFSKRGKELRKLSKIFEGILEEEQVQKKLSPEILRKLTGDENLNYEAFRKYCFSLTNYYIIHHDGYDLYYRVMQCYYSWKEEGR
jgi:hypothetical protein